MQVVQSIVDDIQEGELCDYLESVFWHLPVRVSPV